MRFSLVACAVVFCVGPVISAAEDIQGSITSTKTIFEDSQLVGDVTCAATATPCIDFGASHVILRLNGFRITGPAEPDNPASAMACTTTQPANADGIRIQNQTHVQVIGPGMVQRFRRHGLFLVGAPDVSTELTVRHITSNQNCFSGLLMTGVTNSAIEDMVSVNNASNAPGSPCGGNCIVNSHGNRIRRNMFSGNGSAGPPSNDFGVGLVGNSSGNIIEDNAIGGNFNGVLIQPLAVDNVFRRNVIVGNPPGLISRTFGAAIGADIKDESTTGGSGSRNTFDRNWCIKYIGPGPAVCPNFPGPGPTDNK